MKKGDIILIPFPFTDLTGNKLRPALVLYSSRDDIVVSFITTQIHLKDVYDISILPSEKNGIKKKSLIRLAKIATIDQNLAIGKLGTLEENEIILVNENLIKILEL